MIQEKRTQVIITYLMVGEDGCHRISKYLDY